MRQDSDRQKIEDFMSAFGSGVRSSGRIYFTGGASAVIRGWREMTLDIDLKAEPEPSGFFECLSELKEQLNINIELAAPDQFVPALPAWQDRSMFIAQHGPVGFYHYDFYGQALAKVERGHARDQHDVSSMVQSGLVLPNKLSELFAAVAPGLIRYPAVDAASLTAKINALAQGRPWL